MEENFISLSLAVEMDDESVCLLFFQKLLSLSVTEIQEIREQYKLMCNTKKVVKAIIALCDAAIQFKNVRLDNLVA